jgi:hypothetical protein
MMDDLESLGFPPLDETDRCDDCGTIARFVEPDGKRLCEDCDRDAD